MISAHQLDWDVGRHRILREVGISVEPGELLGLLGPNGSGKSSLLRLLAGITTPTRGSVTLNDVALQRMTARARAREIAMLPQEGSNTAELTVLEVALLGRIPYTGWGQPPDPHAHRIALGMLERFEVRHLAERRWPSLSGGERQRVLLARTFTQQTGIVLLDEFTNHLDIRHQLDALELLHGSGVSVVAALHDLHLAATYCDRVALLDAGTIVAAGAPGQVLTAERISEVYQVAAEVDLDEQGRPHIRLRRAAHHRNRT
ncbi:MAG: ABC transporter ATP-binding protein [Arachnia sp.]